MGKDIKIGKFQEFDCPENAERLSLSYFTENVKERQFSKLLDKELIKNKKIFYCPRCGKRAEFAQKHGDAYKCGTCGLCRQSFGNELYIWNDEVDYDEVHPMGEPQPVQLDCRETGCKYYVNGSCRNMAPAITIYNGKANCWTKIKS